MKVPPNKTGHTSASYRLYVHLVWPTKYRKHVLGEKLTPVVESRILDVCHTRQHQLFIARAAVDHVHVLLGMRPAQAVSDVVRDLKTNSSAAAFATFSHLVEIIKMDVLWAEGYRAESVSPGELEEFGGISSAKRNIIGQSSGFEPGRMRNTSITERPRVGCRDRRHRETPTAYAVGIEAKSYARTTGSRQWLDTSSYADSQTMKYDISNLSRECIEEAVSRNNSAELARAVLSAAIYSDDCTWAESLCYRLSSHVDSHVKGNAVLGLGHIARRYGRFTDSQAAAHVVEAALRDPDGYVRGHAEDAADDIEMFTSCRLLRSS